MSDSEDLESAVESFLSEADSAFEEYDRGYTDADATLRRLEGAIEGLRTLLEDWEQARSQNEQGAGQTTNSTG